MSPVEQVHALWAAFEAGGFPATLAYVGDDCEWVPTPAFPDIHPIRGAGAMRAYLDEKTHEGVRFEPHLHTCEALGDDVVLAGGRMRIVSPAALTDSPLFWVYRLDGGRVTRIEAYPSRRDALSAATA